MNLAGIMPQQCDYVAEAIAAESAEWRSGAEDTPRRPRRR